MDSGLADPSECARVSKETDAITTPYVDYHNHTVLCHHARGTVDEYLESAAEAGIAEFGFAEHSYWMAKADSRQLCPTREEMDLYLRWMDDRRVAWDGRDGRPVLRVGLEADWVPERLEEALAFVESYPFDHILGSVHHFHEPLSGKWTSAWSFDREQDISKIYALYFNEVAALAESGLCDILAHLDVIRRSGILPEEGIMPHFRAVLPRIAASGVAVEINASGRDHSNGDFFPLPEMLRELIAAGVPITFGSDSHSPHHVGRYRDNVVGFLRDCGGREFARFRERQMELVALD